MIPTDAEWNAFWATHHWFAWALFVAVVLTWVVALAVVGGSGSSDDEEEGGK